MLSALFSFFRSRPNPKDFTAQVADLLKTHGMPSEMVGKLELRLTLQGGKEPASVLLKNIYVKCLNDWNNRESLIEEFVKGVLEADTDSLLPKNIIPLISNRASVEQMKTSVRKQDGDPAQFFVVEEYNDDLLIIYAIDSPKTIRFLTPKEVDQVNLYGESLLSFAIKNLENILPNIEKQDRAPLFLLSAGDMFESSLILLDRIWDKGKLGIEGEILVAVPARPIVLVADSNSPESVQNLKTVAAEMALKAAYAISKHVFVRRAGRFVRWD
jgi:uncharacterized protein YtpQ (UPF0354 family)